MTERPMVCPPWCILTDHQGHGMDYHRSRDFEIGPQPRHNGRGVVTVWLERRGHGPVWLAVQAAHMASARADISLADAVLLRDAVDWLIGQSGSA